MKPGDGGADIDFGVEDEELSLLWFGAFGDSCSVIEGVRGGWNVRDKFLVFLGFLLGDKGPFEPGPGLGGGIARSFGRVRIRLPDLKDAIRQPTVSGDESGVDSVVVDSTVDIVVVGDVFVELDVEAVDTLLRGSCIELANKLGV